MFDKHPNKSIFAQESIFQNYDEIYDVPGNRMLEMTKNV
jgi:hypothetical protein